MKDQTQEVAKRVGGKMVDGAVGAATALGLVEVALRNFVNDGGLIQLLRDLYPVVEVLTEGCG